MKKIFKSIVLMLAMGTFIASCDKKVGDLPYYAAGKAPTLSASVTTIAPAPADSNNTVLTLNWTNPNYAVDSASQKYIVEFGAQGTNFSKSVTFTYTDGRRSVSFLAKELNTILLGFDYAFNTPYDIDVRVTSSYGNNNELYVTSPIIIKMTPYKVPPKIALPTTEKLFIVGSATQGGWNNPVPTPSQELTRLDETTWGGIFNFNAGQEFLLLSENGNWDAKFSVADKGLAGLSDGGDFGFGLNDNFPGPKTAGWYKLMVDFQKGKFTVTPYTSTLPSDLFIVGSATPGGWGNPVPASQQLTRLTSTSFTITLAFTGGQEYLLLPVNGSWSNKYSVADKSLSGLNAGGDFGYNLSDNFPGPSASGTYKLDIEFLTGKFKVTKQ